MQHDAVRELRRAFERYMAGEISERQYREILRKARATTMHPPDQQHRRMP